MSWSTFWFGVTMAVECVGNRSQMCNQEPFQCWTEKKDNIIYTYACSQLILSLCFFCGALFHLNKCSFQWVSERTECQKWKTPHKMSSNTAYRANRPKQTAVSKNKTNKFLTEPNTFWNIAYIFSALSLSHFIFFLYVFLRDDMRSTDSHLDASEHLFLRDCDQVR